MSAAKKLRLINYLSPGLPVELFEAIEDYLEEETGLETSLLYESRWSGPPKDRKDPFTLDEVDIGFMSSTEFLRMVRERNQHVELCGAGAVFGHSKNVKGRPYYYTDIVISAANKLKYKDLHDIRGHSLAFSSQKSPSSAMMVLGTLKKMGFNSSFFSNLQETGSHIASIESLLDHRVTAAAVDSNVLFNYLAKHPHQKDLLHVFTSFGPLPSYPIVLNSGLPDDLKAKITDSLLKMSKKNNWSKRLLAFNITEFVPIDMSLYDLEQELTELVHGMSLTTTYY